MKQKKSQKQLTQHYILRKIEKDGVNSAEEYEMIIQNLQRQNLNLRQDREELKIRVAILLQKQKQLLQERALKAKKNPATNYTRLKKQLEDKYIQFGLWQKKVYSSVNKGAINVQVKQHLNRCALVQAQIIKYRKIYYDEKKTFKRLQKSLKDELKFMNKNVPHREVLQQQNKQLRRMIWNLRIVEDLTDHVDIRLHNSIVSLQNKKKFVQKLKTMTIEDIKRQQAKNKIQIINQHRSRHQSLKRLKTQSKMSERMEKSQIQDLQNKEKLLTQKQQQKSKLQKQFNQLQNQRKDLLKQQQKYQLKLTEQQQKINKKLKASQIQFTDVNLQVNVFEDEDPLPNQIVGNQTFITQDDRTVLKTAKDTLITGLIVYQNLIGLACIRALYSNGKQTRCVPPQKYLSQKCKHKKVVLHDPKDFLRWFKVYYDKSQKKIVRIEVFSNNKIKFQAGKQKQTLFKNVIPYKFDTSIHQIPVCLRTSYHIIDNQWVVASLAVQINTK